MPTLPPRSSRGSRDKYAAEEPIRKAGAFATRGSRERDQQRQDQMAQCGTQSVWLAAASRFRRGQDLRDAHALLVGLEKSAPRNFARFVDHIDGWPRDLVAGIEHAESLRQLVIRVTQDRVGQAQLLRQSLGVIDRVDAQRDQLSSELCELWMALLQLT